MKRLLILFSLIPLFGISQSGDCPGQCVVSGGTYAAANGLIDTELSGVGGCLTAGEATSSYWFQVCFTSSGQFFMAMDPSGNRNDFDFAVWNTSNCPPTSSPIRCSWAAVPIGPGASDITGLGNGATDNSEGAGGNQWVAPINVSNNQCLTIGINNYGNGSNVFTINFNGTTASMYCPIALPIELLSFNGEYISQQEKHIKLSWETASELNNDYFTVEKSINGYNWENLIIVNSQGTTNVLQNYSFNDYSLNSDIIYYRLSQTDLDGEKKTFHVIAVTIPEEYRSKLIKIITVSGIELHPSSSYEGFVIEIYDNGTAVKRFMTKNY